VLVPEIPTIGRKFVPIGRSADRHPNRRTLNVQRFHAWRTPIWSGPASATAAVATRRVSNSYRTRGISRGPAGVLSKNWPAAPSCPNSKPRRHGRVLRRQIRFVRPLPPDAQMVAHGSTTDHPPGPALKPACGSPNSRNCPPRYVLPNNLPDHWPTWFTIFSRFRGSSRGKRSRDSLRRYRENPGPEDADRAAVDNESTRAPPVLTNRRIVLSEAGYLKREHSHLQVVPAIDQTDIETGLPAVLDSTNTALSLTACVPKRARQLSISEGERTGHGRRTKASRAAAPYVGPMFRPSSENSVLLDSFIECWSAAFCAVTSPSFRAISDTFSFMGNP